MRWSKIIQTQSFVNRSVPMSNTIWQNSNISAYLYAFSKICFLQGCFNNVVQLHFSVTSCHQITAVVDWLTVLHCWESLRVCVSIYSVCLYSVSNSRLEFVHVSLMHTVMPDQLIWAGELLLTAGPAARKRLLAWERQERKYRNTLY